MNQYKDKYPDGITASFWNTFVVPQVRRIKGNACEHCSSTKRLTVHHESYEQVNINTLKLLCMSCHIKLHRGLLTYTNKSEDK